MSVYSYLRAGVFVNSDGTGTRTDIKLEVRHAAVNVDGCAGNCGQNVSRTQLKVKHDLITIHECLEQIHIR